MGWLIVVLLENLIVVLIAWAWLPAPHGPAPAVFVAAPAEAGYQREADGRVVVTFKGTDAGQVAAVVTMHERDTAVQTLREQDRHVEAVAAIRDAQARIAAEAEHAQAVILIGFWQSVWREAVAAFVVLGLAGFGWRGWVARQQLAVLRETHRHDEEREKYSLRQYYQAEEKGAAQ